MAKAEAKDKKPQEWMYEIVRNPVVTEKSTRGSEFSQITFNVPLSATKPRIKQAVETLFKVNVKSVNTLINKGKTKRFRGIKSRRSDVKKAVISLKEGQVIDTGAGL